ncbi:MAG: hypothetical protein ACKVVP_20435 [Chloroflexota bacterium]
MIVTDASLAIKLVTREADSPAAFALWRKWTNDGEQVVAPTPF